jgi:6-pyruvoyltetrahydropterin/6-carboxytetrahydropterin synthase
MIYLTKRYGFFASHRLHSPALTETENQEVYGKCNNPHGHGHNYEIEVTVRGEIDSLTGRAVDLTALNQFAEREILAPFRYRNLNEEIPAFRDVVPTTENLGLELDRRLRASWTQIFGEKGPTLERIRILETERNICEVSRGDRARLKGYEHE